MPLGTQVWPGRPLGGPSVSGNHRNTDEDAGVALRAAAEALAVKCGGDLTALRRRGKQFGHRGGELSVLFPSRGDPL